MKGLVAKPQLPVSHLNTLAAIDVLDRQFLKRDGECLPRQFHFYSSKSNVNSTSPLAGEISVEGHTEPLRGSFLPRHLRQALGMCAKCCDDI